MVALTVPWIILLSRSRAYVWVRRAGGALAAIASIGWMVNRISGEPNLIETWTSAATKLAPLGIVVLAAIAIPAYFLSALRTPIPSVE